MWAVDIDLPSNYSLPHTGKGFVVWGAAAGDFFGRSVSAGDINNDGFDDFIIGASNADPNDASSSGESYVVFGQSEFDAFVNLSDLAILG